MCSDVSYQILMELGIGFTKKMVTSAGRQSFPYILRVYVLHEDHDQVTFNQLIFIFPVCWHNVQEYSANQRAGERLGGNDIGSIYLADARCDRGRGTFRLRCLLNNGAS